MEHCDMDLEKLTICKNAHFSEDELRVFLLQLKEVFLLMDRKNFIHRDLKLKNFLVCINQEVKEQNVSLEILYNPCNFTVKLSDFGFAKILVNDITDSIVGTPITMAPEIFDGKNYNKKVDIWSMGVIMYQLLYKTYPIKAKNQIELNKKVREYKGFEPPKGFTASDSLRDLFNHTLQLDVNKRFTWEEFYEHHFFPKNIIIEKDIGKLAYLLFDYINNLYRLVRLMRRSNKWSS